ncbi:hypothetical protein V8E36_000018 [Tilletia maclaganii]
MRIALPKPKTQKTRKADAESSQTQDSKRARTSGAVETEAGSSTMKVAPIFKKQGKLVVRTRAYEQFRWLPAFGPQSTCHVALFGDPLPDSAPLAPNNLKAAIYDLDGTLVVPKSGKVHPERENEYDFRFLTPNTLRKVQDEYRIHKRTVVIVTNQGYFKPGMKRDAAFDVWKKKQKLISEALEIPHMVFVATGEDRFRKPAIGMFDAFWSILLNQLHKREPEELAPKEEDEPSTSAKGKAKASTTRRKPKAPEGAALPPVQLTEIESLHFDAAQSFYVGDAAGRTGDHSDVDRKWASNVGIQFYTPEQYFTDAKEQPFKLSGWTPRKPADLSSSSSSSLPLFSPTSTPLVPANADERDDVILFVGPPAAGKTEFYTRFLKPWGYEWVNQDTLYSADACRRAVKKHLEAGKGCVVDNTNRNKKTRSAYITLARELNKPIRCFYFDIEKQQAYHNNAFRANSGLDSGRSLIPPFAIQQFYNDLEKPTLDEGFSEEPKKLSWQFVHSDEEKTRRYFMHYV